MTLQGAVDDAVRRYTCGRLLLDVPWQEETVTLRGAVDEAMGKLEQVVQVTHPLFPGLRAHRLTQSTKTCAFNSTRPTKSPVVPTIKSRMSPIPSQ